MTNYENIQHKIYKLYLDNKKLNNKIDKVDYKADKSKKINIIQKSFFYESDWILCSPVIIYEEDNIYIFSFNFAYDLSINEKQIPFLNYTIIFKGNIISYKELSGGEILIGTGFQNIVISKIDDNQCRIIISGLGIVEGIDVVYAKSLLSINNESEYKTIKKYEIL